ncbi:MAG: protein disulfide bond isomerase, DsbC/DsbG-like [Deltaproteobacteria bacterium]|nr:protein disulfide bond isomerase, DsbC/DsbG-like [Deltaproteobacteria bacterium]
MHQIFLAISILMTMLFPSVGFTFQGPPGCGQDCASCHSLTKEEASKLLKLEVDNVSQASAKGLWEVTGKQNGKTVKVHMDYGKKYAIVIQAMIPIEKIGKPPEMKKLDVKSIPLADSLIVGDPDAKNKLIVRKDISFYVKLFPLVKLHPQSYEKSKAVQCKNSVKLLDDAFEGKDVPKVECETKVLDENIKLAEKLGISGTPAIILPDGRLVPGYMDAQNLLKLMETPQ